MAKTVWLDALSLGLEMAIAVFLGAFLGYQADVYWRTSPWGMVVGVLVGALAGFWNAVKLALRQDEHT